MVLSPIVALGGRAKLSAVELEFVGVVARHRDTSGGWRQPYGRTYETDSILSAEDTAVLQALMNAGSADTVDFMG